VADGATPAGSTPRRRIAIAAALVAILAGLALLLLRP